MHSDTLTYRVHRKGTEETHDEFEYFCVHGTQIVRGGANRMLPVISVSALSLAAAVVLSRRDGNPYKSGEVDPYSPPTRKDSWQRLTAQG